MGPLPTQVQHLKKMCFMYSFDQNEHLMAKATLTLDVVRDDDDHYTTPPQIPPPKMR
jgi:hypothetical protein